MSIKCCKTNPDPGDEPRMGFVQRSDVKPISFEA